MGAHDFSISQRAETAEQAYKICVENAFYESGHDPYNGTISTTNGFRMILPLPNESKNDHRSRILDNTEKRGECACWPDPKVSELWHFAGWAAC